MQSFIDDFAHPQVDDAGMTPASAASTDAEILDLCRRIDAVSGDFDILTAGRYQLTEMLQGAGQSATLDALRAAAKIAAIPTNCQVVRPPWRFQRSGEP